MISALLPRPNAASRSTRWIHSGARILPALRLLLADHRIAFPSRRGPEPAAPPVRRRYRPPAAGRVGRHEMPLVGDRRLHHDDPICDAGLGRTLGLRQLRHDQLVRGVDQVRHLIIRNRPVEGKGVPAVLADIGRLADELPDSDPAARSAAPRSPHFKPIARYRRPGTRRSCLQPWRRHHLPTARPATHPAWRGSSRATVSGSL